MSTSTSIMNTEHHISILMPVYNGIEFIEESVSSVINQTAQNWELLIGINGHPPNSDVFQLAQNYISTLHDKRIKVIDFHECKGKPTTLNKMILYCNPKFNYVAILDVDDIWFPQKLELQNPYLLQNYDVIGARCVYFGDRNNIIPNTPYGDISNFDFLSVNPVINSSSIILKSLAYWNDIVGVEDYDLWLRLWKEKKRFYVCEKVLVKHRIHQSSAFNAKGNHNTADILKKKYM